MSCVWGVRGERGRKYGRLGDVWNVGKESGDERGVERIEGVKAGM